MDRDVHDPLSVLIARRGAAVLDGGLATELEARGLDLNHPLWSARAIADAPEIVEAVHRDYLEAGADVVTSATYQAPVPLIAPGVAIALRARDAFASGADRPLVAASLGPYGASLADGSEYRGDYGLSIEALADWHRPRVRAAEETGADVLAFETIPSGVEVEAIARVLGERDGLPVWISFQARDGSALADGTPVEAAATTADRATRVIAVGVNCVAPERVVPLLRRLASATKKPLVAYPNRGDAWDATRRNWIVRGDSVDLGALAPLWRDAGARLIGGCCRTTPGDVAAIRRALAAA
ncbi:MAG TPA: homocysteine S-methyltransferase [Candidatus Polarisedimenticolaceae bacterium]|nr:homocysteine S-methyltransferase [Candidatus Polarisedimenticolaceae bacterium]